MDDIPGPDEEPASRSSSIRLSRLPTFKVERYREHLSGDIDDETAEELLRTVWSIMCTFVELGWGVESVQNVLPFMRAGDRVGADGDEVSGRKNENE